MCVCIIKALFVAILCFLCSNNSKHILRRLTGSTPATEVHIISVQDFVITFMFIFQNPYITYQIYHYKCVVDMDKNLIISVINNIKNLYLSILK